MINSESSPTIRDNAARGLDHIVIGVHDLDAAADLYTRLGFTVGRRNQHPWGTVNRIVQFPGAFLELITIGDAALIPPHRSGYFSFGAFVRDALARGEGLSMAVLESLDAEGDAARFKAGDIGDFEPFSFERKGMGPDGEEVRVAFTLSFAEDKVARDCGFFVCQQHEPRNFWNPQAQLHANGVTGLAAVLMVAENPTDHHIFLISFTGQRSLESTSFGISAHLPRGRFDILTPPAAAFMLGDPALAGDARARYAGFAVTVPDLAVLGEKLRASSIGFIETPGRIILPAAQNHGTAIAFEMHRNAEYLGGSSC
jgi:catechol 2,3-dioxygenase-like lactoylglutathione lyase family enzyme